MGWGENCLIVSSDEGEEGVEGELCCDGNPKMSGILRDDRGTRGLFGCSLQDIPSDVDGLAMGSCLELIRTFPAVRFVLP